MDMGADIIDIAGELLSGSDTETKRQPITCTVEYPLLPEHLADYADQHGQLATAQKADEKDIQTLRAKHHGIARLLAEGVPEGVVAEMSGVTASHLSVLKNTPAMIELVTFYRGPKNESAKLIGEKLRTVADMSLEVFQNRLEREPDKVSNQELLSASKLGFDRSGHGPQSTVTNISETRLVAPEELVELAREARRKDATRIVDVRTVRAVLPAPEGSTNGSESRDGLPGDGTDGDEHNRL